MSPAACTVDNELYWDIKRTKSNENVIVRYFYLDWTDIIKKELDYSILITLWRLIFSQNILWRLIFNFNMGNGGPFSLVCLYSVILTFLYLVVFLSLSIAAMIGIAADLGYEVALPISGFLLFMLMKTTHILEPKVFAYFFLKTLNFSDKFAKALPPDLTIRINDWSDAIRKQLDAGHEVVLVGHSYGALLSAPLIARLMADEGIVSSVVRDRLKVIHFGALHPLITLDPDYNWYHEAIDHLERTGVTWIEVFSGWDSLNFPKYDPRYQPKTGQTGPAFRDIDFFEHCRVPVYDRRRYRIFLNHFRYLMAKDACCQFDYFDYLFADKIEDYWNPPPKVQNHPISKRGKGG